MCIKLTFHYIVIIITACDANDTIVIVNDNRIPSKL